MEYTVTRSGQPTDDEPARYNDETAVLMLRRAIRQGFGLSADAATGTVTLTDAGRWIILTPAEPLPKPTVAQRREILALASSPGPIEWDYGRTNVVQVRDWGAERLIKHAMAVSLINGGYLGPLTGKGNPARLSLLTYLVIGKGSGDDLRLAAMLANVFRAPAVARPTPEEKNPMTYEAPLVTATPRKAAPLVTALRAKGLEPVVRPDGTVTATANDIAWTVRPEPHAVTGGPCGVWSVVGPAGSRGQFMAPGVAAFIADRTTP